MKGGIDRRCLPEWWTGTSVKNQWLLSPQVWRCACDWVQALVGLNSPTIFSQIINFNHVLLFHSISLSVLCQFDLCKKPPTLITHRISHISECSWMYLQSYWLSPAFICLALCGTCLLAACLRTPLICYICCISVGKPLLTESIKQTHGIPTVCSDLQNLFSYHS